MYIHTFIHHASAAGQGRHRLGASILFTCVSYMSLSLSLYTYMYICIYREICVYIYIYRERERERCIHTQ